MSAAPDSPIAPDPAVAPPRLAPLELERLRGSVRAGLFAAPAELPRVGRYTLLRCIGHGGMGIVYAARDEELGREVAIKLLRAELADDEGGRLTREARALARLAHPNVVAVFDVGVHAGQRFIAMELVSGEDLRRWLGSPRTLREVLRVFAAAGRGLAAAHAVGLVHRDFKPDNVLVGDDGRPRVLDFGLARPPDAADAAAAPPVLPRGVDPFATTFTSTGVLLGTPAYMAPEQYLGEPADARSDQFSFAVALYHAVYGERPFAGDDPQSLALSIVRGRVRPTTPRYPVPPWLEALLGQALRVDPDGRFASMDALVDALDAGSERADPAVLDALPTRAFVAGPRPTGSGALAVFDGFTGAIVDAATPSERALAVPPAPSVAMPPEAEHGGAITSLSTRRTLPHAISEAALGRMTTELDRLAGRRGKITRLGTGLAWSTRALEVHIDIDAAGTRVLVWRRLSPALRRRRASTVALGLVVGALLIAIIMEGLGPLARGLEPLVILGLFGLGGASGLHVANERHARALPARRAELEFVADRLMQLAGAREAPLALDG